MTKMKTGFRTVGMVIVLLKRLKTLRGSVGITELLVVPDALTRLSFHNTVRAITVGEVSR